MVETGIVTKLEDDRMRIKLYCPDCDRAYSWDTDSIEHINSVHCIYCGRKFHMDSIVKRIYRGVEDAACQFFAQQITQNNASHKIAKQMAKAFCNIHLKKMPKSMVMKKCGRGWDGYKYDACCNNNPEEYAELCRKTRYVSELLDKG